MIIMRGTQWGHKPEHSPATGMSRAEHSYEKMTLPGPTRVPAMAVSGATPAGRSNRVLPTPSYL
jgi:hypothetical protein